MIAPLRARHRRFMTALAVLLPIAYVAALSTRPTWPDSSASPPRAPTDATQLDGDLRAAAWLDARGRLVVAPQGDPRLPDVLLYWTPAPALAVGDELPTDARLLGALAGGAQRILAAPPGEPGVLIAYSLAQARIVGRGPAPKGGE